MQKEKSTVKDKAGCDRNRMHKSSLSKKQPQWTKVQDDHYVLR